jgi:hypothetical protein
MGSALLVEQFAQRLYVCFQRLNLTVHLGHIVRGHVLRIVPAMPCAQADKLILGHPHARLTVILAGVATPLPPLRQDPSGVPGDAEALG